MLKQMRRLFLIILFNLLINLPSFALSDLPTPLVSLNSEQGIHYLLQSKNKNSYVPLLMNFVTQKNQAYCSIASSVMIFNVLGLPAPIDPAFKPYAYFTQDNFFSPNHSSSTINPDFVSHHGLTLEQLANLLASYPVKVQIIFGDAISLNEFRRTLVNEIQKPHTMLMVNFLRTALQQSGHGHFSPIAAYDKSSDRFLILDVARYRYPAFWVETKILWEAIKTIDPVSQKSRGVLVIHT